MSVVLSEHLPLLALAPNGIQKLRGLILELAVRGKLVPQDPNDEPASELLKRIAKERARLEAEGTCKKSKATPLSDDDPKPFDIPAGWSWVRIAEIGHDWGQKTPDADFTYVDVSAIDNERGTVDSPTVVAPADAPSRARKVVRRGTVIYSTVRPYLLNIAVIDRDLAPAPIASTAFAVIHPFVGLSSQYIFWYLRSPVFVRYVESVQTGIAYPAVNDSQFFSGLFPLPPLEEQHRIVAKVDELMALCDRLEAEVGAGDTAHARLVETLLGTLTQSTDATDLATSWQRLAEHFDILFTTEASLNTLKQTILQLAVMGKLVPQDPSDEPASELLKRIANERARLEVEGKIKKNRSVSPVGAGEQLFVVPEGWLWARFGTITEMRLGKMLDAAKNRGDFKPYLRNTNVQWWHFELDDIKELRLTPDELDEFRLVDGDLLICEGGEPGRCAIWHSATDEMYFQKALHRARPYGGVQSEYLQIVLRQDATSGALATYFTGATIQHFPGEKLNAYAIPLPPIAEQHRIVAKVDELMALCDRLKSDLTESRARQDRLATTLIDTALKAA